MDRQTIEQVLEAAEAAAAEIERNALEDARRVREQAERDAEGVRAEARESAREHLAAMMQVTARLVEHLGSLEAAAPRAQAAPATKATPPAPPAQVSNGGDPPSGGELGGGGGAEDGEDLDGARLIALNMALNGESRADTERYLAEHFTLSDRAKLIEEVYAAVEG